MIVATNNWTILSLRRKKQFCDEPDRDFPAWLSLLCSDFPTCDRFKPNWPIINFLCFASTLNFPARMSFPNKMWTFPSKEEKQKQIISAWPALYQSLLVFLTYSEKKYPEYFFSNPLDLFRNVVWLKGKLGVTSWFLQSCHYFKVFFVLVCVD